MNSLGTVNAVNNTATPAPVRGFPNVILPERNYTISGTTLDANGLALGSCTVRLFNTATNLQEQVATSSVVGAYSFTVDKTQNYYTVEYNTGPPAVYGSSVNTLAGA